VNAKNANIKVGYKNGDVALKLKSSVNTGTNAMTHKAGAYTRTHFHTT